MAATSTNGIRRRMGRRWQQLHYGIYVAGILGVWHFWWQVKLDTSEPAVYAAILAVLLGYRLRRSLQRPRARSRTTVKASRPAGSRTGAAGPAPEYD
jgi:sulfoxide reductase heme-binding subunit YedZ